ncbi:MAG TPA: hypothetical protein VMV01_01840, partial [Planctomycetota bacterium]|nr:hypothetical protein [Planctomycetota bacterium]
TDLGGSRPEAAALRSRLEQYQLLTMALRAAAGEGGQYPSDLDPAVIEQLIQMGYIEAPKDRASK